MDWRIWIEAAVWTSIGLIVHSYVLYPAVLEVAARRRRRLGRIPVPPATPSDWEAPRAVLLVAAHNEAGIIRERLENALAMDYPREKLTVVVASDGSTDGTDSIARAFAAERGIGAGGPRVRLFAAPGRRGKTANLNAAIDRIRTEHEHPRDREGEGDPRDPSGPPEIVLFTDANTFHRPEAARNLVRWFASDPEVVAVCGRLNLVDHKSGRNPDGAYWKYETALKTREGALDALLGANGAIYAVRLERYVAPPDDTIVDDFVIPLLAKLRGGGVIRYDAEAVADEETPPDIASEFRRRARIGAGAFQSLAILWPLLHPRHGWTAFAFLSHKLLRWITPFLMIVALVGSIALVAAPGSGGPPTRHVVLVGAQMVFYVLALAGLRVPNKPAFLKIPRICAMFVGMNLALLAGFQRWLAGNLQGTWTPTRRS